MPHPALEKLRTTVMTNIRAGHLDEARVLINRALRDFPDDACLHHLCGAVAFLKGNHGGAETSLKQSCELDSGNPEVFFDLALAQAHQKKFADATDALKTCLGLRPDNHAARLHLALLLIQARDCKTALEHLMHLPRGSTNDEQRDLLIAVAAFECGENDIAHTRLEALQYVRADDALTVLLQGQLHFERADYAAALASFRTAEGLRVSPIAAAVPVVIPLTNPLASHEAAQSLSSLASGLDEEAFAAWHRGRVWRGMHRHDRALTWFERSLALMPDHPDFAADRARTLDLLGRADDANQAYREMQNHHPQSAASCIAAAARANQAGEYTSALQHLSLLPADNQDPAVFLEKGRALLGLSRAEEALEPLRQAVRLDPENAATHVELIRAYTLTGKTLLAKKQHQLLQLI